MEQALSGFTSEELELFSTIMRKVTDATIHARQQAIADAPE